MSQAQLAFEETMELIEEGRFSYIRPRQGDEDYAAWVNFGCMFYRRALAAGREPGEELFVETRAFADELGSSLFAMRAGEINLACFDRNDPVAAEVRNAKLTEALRAAGYLL